MGIGNGFFQRLIGITCVFSTALGLWVSPIAFANDFTDGLDQTVQHFKESVVRQFEETEVRQEYETLIRGSVCKGNQVDPSFDGVSLSLLFDAAKLYKVPAALGLTASGMLELTVFRQEDNSGTHLKYDLWLAPSLGYESPAEVAEKISAKSLLKAGDLSFGLVFGCDRDPDTYIGYFLNVTAGPINVALGFSMENLMFNAMTAFDASNYALSYSDFKKDFDQANEEIKQVSSQIAGPLQILPQGAWTQGVSTLLDHYKARSKAPSYSARMEVLLDELAVASKAEDSFSAQQTNLQHGTIHSWVDIMYQETSNQLGIVTNAVLPLLKSPASVDYLLGTEVIAAKGRYWISTLSPYHYETRKLVERECDKNRFVAAFKTNAEGTKRYVWDCSLGHYWDENSFSVVKSRLDSIRILLTNAQRDRTAMMGLRNVMNNAYAGFLNHQKVDYRALRIGGVAPDRIWGCNVVGTSVQTLIGSVRSTKKLLKSLVATASQATALRLSRAAISDVTGMKLAMGGALGLANAVQPSLSYMYHVADLGRQTNADNNWIPRRMREFIENPCSGP